MDFSLHMRSQFLVRGRPATYAAPSGAVAVCRVIRQGGGRAVTIGAVTVTVDRTAFHVRRAELPLPMAGGLLTVGAETFGVDAVQPVERDAEGLLWSLESSWGVPLLYRPAGAAAPAALSGGPWQAGAAAAAGAGTITIRSRYVTAAGQLPAGSTLTIGAAVHTTTAPVSPTGSRTLVNVAIVPVLAAALSVGDAVTITPPAAAGGHALRGAVADYEASEIAGTVLVGDRRLVLLASQFQAAGMAADPKPGDLVVIGARAYSVITTNAVFQGSAVAAWILQVR